MQNGRPLITVCFCAGMLGALVSSLTAWQIGRMGLPAMAGVSMAPDLSPGWLYAQAVWGGFWGLAYFLTVCSARSRCHWARKGLWISTLPTAFQLFYIYPSMTGNGWLGLDLGQLAPVFVFSYNLIWGFFTGIFTRVFWGRG